MSVTLNINGTDYFYPTNGDVSWGVEASDWASAVTSGMLQKAGGLFLLLDEVDFGSDFGLKSIYFKSGSDNPADDGAIRLSNTDAINFRNFDDDGNLSLTVNSSDQLVYDNGVISQPIQAQISVVDTATINLTLAGTDLSADINSDSITNSMINSAAAIAYSKLALSNSILNADINASAAIDASKIADGSVSNTEFQYINSVTSNVQTQLDSKQATGSYITALTGDGTASGPGSAALTLATVNSNVGSFGSASSVATLTANAKGLITAAGSTSIQIAESQVTNLVSDLAGKQATGNYITALTGDVTASGPGSVASTLATVNSNVGSFTSANFTVNAKGLITAASNGTTPNFAVTSKTTTYAILTTDSVILCSGSAFTVTLPTAVGVTGKVYIIQKTDSSLTNIITIATTSSQTIGAGGGTTTTLNTQGESLTLTSDGSNWQIIDRRIPTAAFTWVPAVTSSTGGTNPSKNSPTIDTATLTRVGSMGVVQYTYRQTATGASGSGGIYLFSMYSGISIDSTRINFDTGNGVVYVGSGWCGGSADGIGGTNRAAFVSPYNATNFIIYQMESSTQLLTVNPTTTNFGGAVHYSVTFTVPISGWNS